MCAKPTAVDVMTLVTSTGALDDMLLILEALEMLDAVEGALVGMGMGGSEGSIAVGIGERYCVQVVEGFGKGTLCAPPRPWDPSSGMGGAKPSGKA